MKLNFETERMGNANVRGLHNDRQYADQQHFELFMPPRMIEDYRNNFLVKVQKMVTNTNQ